VTIEYWVMRVTLPHGRPRTASAQIAALALVGTADWCLLPSGDFCEPIEVYESEQAAHEHARELQRKAPAEDFRVIMNADVAI